MITAPIIRTATFETCSPTNPITLPRTINAIIPAMHSQSINYYNPSFNFNPFKLSSRQGRQGDRGRDTRAAGESLNYGEHEDSDDCSAGSEPAASGLNGELSGMGTRTGVL